MRISDCSSDVCSSDLPFALHIAKSIDGSSGLLSVPARNGWLTATNGYCDDSAVHTALLLPCRRAINSPSATVAANHRKGKQRHDPARYRSEEHTSELQSLMRISNAVFCLKKKKHRTHNTP